MLPPRLRHQFLKIVTQVVLLSVEKESLGVEKNLFEEVKLGLKEVKFLTVGGRRGLAVYAGQEF